MSGVAIYFLIMVVSSIMVTILFPLYFPSMKRRGFQRYYFFTAGKNTLYTH